MKHSNPVELADYSINNKIDDQPAFAWWVPHVVQKRKLIIAKIKTKYWQQLHKYGIRIPKSVKEALEIDAANRNSYWKDAIEMEMPKIKDSVEEYDGDVDNLIGYQQIKGHIIFDIKLGENFCRKA